MLRALLLGLIISTPNTYASSPCECTGVNSFDKKDSKCMQFKPAKVELQCFGKKDSDACSATGEAVVSTQSQLEKLTSKASPIKSYDELLDYVSCYRTSTSDKFSGMTADQQFCHFKKNVAPYIKLAAESAHLNPTVFACLIKAESEFDPKAKSKVGAMSYPQFMPSALETVGDLIETPAATQREKLKPLQENIDELTKQIKELDDRLSPMTTAVEPLKLLSKEQQKQVAEWTKKLKKNPKSAAYKKELAAAKKELAKTYADIANAKKDYLGPISERNKLLAELKGADEDYRAREAKVRIAETWESYWEGTNPIPRDVNKKKTWMLSCPRVAFALSAVKQVYDLHAMFSTADLPMSDSGDFYIDDLAVSSELTGNAKIEQQVLDTSVYLYGAYNRGTGRYTELCKPKLGLKHCLSFRKRTVPLETVAHMNAINNCASAGSTKPMRWDWEKKSVPDDKDCEDQKCSK